jgi:hypothetical protein
VLRPAEGCRGESCPPAEPRCYTPCSGSFTDADGVYRVCSPEGLLEGCLEGAACVDGSCVPVVDGAPAAAVGACAGETDCPDFQTCLDGRCYATCEKGGECAPGYGCVRHVCRKECTDTAECEGELVCREGACLPTLGADGEPAPPPGVLSVDVALLQFTTRVDSGSFQLHNGSERTQVITVRKLEHSTVDEDGRTVSEHADRGGTPLGWLQLGIGVAGPADRVVVTVPPGESRTVALAGARNPALSRWTGTLEIASAEGTRKLVPLAYSEEVQGRWAGTAYFFGNFEDGLRPELDRSPLDDWIADRANIAAIDRVPNAFLQAWARFRNRTFSLAEMQALVSATLGGSWQSQRVKELCREAGYGAGAACAPFGGVGSESVLLYTSSVVDNPVPSGVAEVDLALNLRPATPTERAAEPRCAGSPHCFVGRIETSQALHYGGNPSLVLRFASDPVGCAQVGEAGCVNFVEDLSAELAIGGRYFPGEDESGCTRRGGMVAYEVPWLVPGFLPAGARVGETGGARIRRECRDQVVPYGSADRNAAYAGANPVPDGLPRHRRLELVDAMLVEQHVLLLLLRETTDAFHGGPHPLATYGYAVLFKQPTELEPGDYVGTVPVDDRPPAASALRVACDDDLIRTVTGVPRTRPIEELRKEELRALARAVVRGDTSAVGDAPPPAVDADGAEQVHYLCVFREETVEPGAREPTLIQREVFDAGPLGTVPCPAGATVVFFTVGTADFGEDFDVAGQPCNTPRETCLATLRDWVQSGRKVRLSDQARTLFADLPGAVATDLVYQCEGETLADCPDDRYDLRAGKRFLSSSANRVYFHPIETDIREAFRYRTQFASRTGTAVGFAPEPCAAGSNLVPYCYDAARIEEVEARVDCALAVYHHHLAAGRFDPAHPDDAATLETLRRFLEKNFALVQTDDHLGVPRVEYGFERLHAELLIMLGDDAYTASFASRFDLAGASNLVFEGDRFEEGGVLLSGGAGYELYRLYQAVQYYGMVLDRFYAAAPLLWAAIGVDPALRYLGEATVTTYLERVTRASTQAAAAWAEIARRYQALNRPDLARLVLERAYARTSLESAILTEVMTQLTLAVSPPGIAQVRTEIENAQRRYKVALLAMRQAYDRIDDEVNFFGLPPDYVPFPALGADDENGFEVLLARAQERAEAAAILEQAALASSREYEVDEAAFQAELVTIRAGYEKELGDLCGTFVGIDGRVYAAIPRYAHLSAETARFADPCGEVETGALAAQLRAIQDRQLQIQRVRRELDHKLAEAADAREWVAVQCGLILEDVNRFLTDQRAIDDLQGSLDSTQTAISALDRTMDVVTGIADRTAEVFEIVTPWGSLGAVAINNIWAASAVVHYVTTIVLEDQIRRKQAQIRDRERQYEAWTIGRQCDYLTAELVYTLRDLQRQMDLGELDALQATWDLQTELSNLKALLHERSRLEAEWEDAEALAIEAAAARTDPNVRIYKNDAVINADRAFTRAIQEAYRATRVFEYDTAQSYPALDQLFLVRLVDYGDVNLRNYLAELEAAYHEFEERFGPPDTRVEVISLRDDVLQIPRYSADGEKRILTAEERVALFRERLRDPAMRDRTGALAVPFSTTFDRLSPLTVNHRILLAEVELFGDAGDDLARVYLRQSGTGVIRDAEGNRRYYTFPERTAVMNAFLNGNRAFLDYLPGPNYDVYRSTRFRERPFVQTRWELVLDQANEAVNEDVSVDGLDDIVVYVYYTDYTP